MGWATVVRRENGTDGVELSVVLQKRTQPLHTPGCRNRPRRGCSLYPSEQHLHRERTSLALLGGKAGKCAELIPLSSQLETHGAPRRQVLFDLRRDSQCCH